MKLINIIMGLIIFGLSGSILFSAVGDFQEGYNFTVEAEEYTELSEQFNNVSSKGKDAGLSLTDSANVNRSISSDDITGSLEVETISELRKTFQNLLNTFKTAINVIVNYIGIPIEFFYAAFTVITVIIGIMLLNFLSKNKI